MIKHVPFAIAFGAIVLMVGLAFGVVTNERKAPIAWMLACGPCDRTPQPVTQLSRLEDGSWSFINASGYSVHTTEICTAVASPVRK